MEKPDYIPFSQEIFDECESLRLRFLADSAFRETAEYNREAIRLARFILSPEYGKYLDLVHIEK